MCWPIYQIVIWARQFFEHQCTIVQAYQAFISFDLLIARLLFTIVRARNWSNFQPLMLRHFVIFIHDLMLWQLLVIVLFFCPTALGMVNHGFRHVSLKCVGAPQLGTVAFSVFGYMWLLTLYETSFFVVMHFSMILDIKSFRV